MEGSAPQVPLAQVWDLEELKRRYSVYDDRLLLRWRDAVTGRHRAAIEALLRERGVLL